MIQLNASRLTTWCCRPDAVGEITEVGSIAPSLFELYQRRSAMVLIA